MKKLINVRLTNILEDKGLNNDNQHGFRPNRGTQTELGLLYETIATLKANGNRIDIVLRDISRAFDNVCHDGLRYKLLNADLPDCLTILLGNYLTNQTAQIRIGDYIRPRFALCSGVPQRDGGACHQLYLPFTHTTCQLLTETHTTYPTQTTSLK